MTRKKQHTARVPASHDIQIAAPEYLKGHPVDIVSQALARAEVAAEALTDFLLYREPKMGESDKRKLSTMALLIDENLLHARQALDALVQADIEHREAQGGEHV